MSARNQWFSGWHRNPVHTETRQLSLDPARGPSSREIVSLLKGLNLRAKIELPIVYSYPSRRRLYIMRRVFLRYTLCTRRRISSKLVSSVRRSRIHNGHTWGRHSVSGGESSSHRASIGPIIQYIRRIARSRSSRRAYRDQFNRLIINKLCPRMDNVCASDRVQSLSFISSKFDIYYFPHLHLIWKVADLRNPTVPLISFKSSNIVMI